MKNYKITCENSINESFLFVRDDIFPSQNPKENRTSALSLTYKYFEDSYS